MDSEFTNEIAVKRQHVLGKYQAYKTDLVNCEKRLENLLKYQKFSLNADEFERWIADRMTNAKDNSWKNKSNLQVYLQKHDALEAEVYANEATLNKLDADGKEIIDNDAPSKDAVQTRLMDIHQQWGELIDALKLRLTRLQQSISVKLYLQRCEEVLYWIRDKEATVESQEIGSSSPLSHVELLKSKMDDFLNEINAYEDSVNEIRKEATKLVEEDRAPDNEVVLAKSHEVEESWARLKRVAQARARLVQTSIEVQTFKRDVEEAISWMSEKEELLRSDDVGSDVTSVELLQRRHLTIERDLDALEHKVNLLRAEAERLEKNEDESRDKKEGDEEKEDAEEEEESEIGSLRDEMTRRWEEVRRVAGERKALLDKHLRVRKFAHDCDELLAWAHNIKALMTAYHLPLPVPDQSDAEDGDEARPAVDVVTAEGLVDKHQEHQGEISAQEKGFTEVIECGRYLLTELGDKSHDKDDIISLSSSSSSSSSSQSGDDKKDEEEGMSGAMIEGKVEAVVRCREELLEVWEERRCLYDQCLHLALFNRDAEQAETWLATQESLLNSDESGFSLDSTQALVKKHDDLVKSVSAQEEKIASVCEVASRLVDKNHYAKRDIQMRKDNLTERHAALREGLTRHGEKLNDELQVRLFERDIDSLLSWIGTKMLIAMDDSYKDGANVHAKLQRHRVFDDEIRANTANVHEQLGEKSTALRANTAASAASPHTDHLIAQHCDRIKDEWGKLLQQSALKGQRLEDSYAEQMFNRSVADLSEWCSKVEQAVSSRDEGADVQGVSELVKRHQLLEVDVHTHKDRVEGIALQADKFEAERHFNCDAIRDKQRQLADKYNQLQEPLKQRQTNLSNSLKAKLLLRDISDEMEWLSEKMLLASSPYIGKDLQLVGVVARKHDIVKSEILSHQQQFDHLCARADELVKQENKDKDEIGECKGEMMIGWKKLLEACDKREELLKDAMEAAEYLDSSTQAQQWVDEKKRIMASYGGKGSDVEMSEDLAEAILRKHDNLLNDIQNYQPTISALRQQATACKLQSPLSKCCNNESVQVVHDYRAKSSRELSVRQNDHLALVSSYNKEWWKVENESGKSGFVPSVNLRKVQLSKRKRRSESDSDEDDEDAAGATGNHEDDKKHPTLAHVQDQLEKRYDDLVASGEKRRRWLEGSVKRFHLIRECDDNLMWICEQKRSAHQYKLDHQKDTDGGDDAKSAVTSSSIEGVGLEEVEELKKQLDEFQRDLKASGKHIERLNAQVQALDAPPTNDKTSSSSDDAAAAPARRRSSSSSVSDGGASSSSSSAGSDGDDESEEKRRPSVSDRSLDDKIQLLNKEWNSLQEMINNLNENLGSAHQVQRFFRDADETNEWIAEKRLALRDCEVGDSLGTVQALQRKHEGLERELAALGERIYSLDEDAATLSRLHPDQSEPIQAKRTAVNKQWNEVVEAAKERKRCLSDSHDLQRFLADYRDVEKWMESVGEAVSSEQLGEDLAHTEALIHRHQECRTDIDGKSPLFSQLERQADELVANDNASKTRIDEIVQLVSHKREDIERCWALRHVKLEQCLKLHLFMRDCENAESWMRSREDFLEQSDQNAADSLDGVEYLIKKHEDFDRAISIQQTKMESLREASEKLTSPTADPPHYAAQHIQDKMQQVEERWEKLKKGLMRKRSELGESRSLQQFGRDADEVENWIVDKLQLATDCSYKDSANIKSKHQKHETFEAELESNKDRVEAIIGAGNRLMQLDNCPPESQQAVKARIDQLGKDWENLKEKSKEKSIKLNDANQQHDFVISTKNLQLWMSEVEKLLENEDVGRDVSSTEKLLKKQAGIEADVLAHQEIVADINQQGDKLKRKQSTSSSSSSDEDDADDAIDSKLIADKQEEVNNKLSELKVKLKRRRSVLENSLKVHQFMHDVNDEEVWINEKKVVISNEDCGKDLTSCKRLAKKHKRISQEVIEHGANIERIKKTGDELKCEVVGEGDEKGGVVDEISACVGKLENNYVELTGLCERKGERLDEAQAYHKFRFDVGEEMSYLAMKSSLLDSHTLPDSLRESNKALVKFESLAANVRVHQERIGAIKAEGERLIQQGNPDSDSIRAELDSLVEREAAVKGAVEERLARLEQITRFVRFGWKSEQVLVWMGEKLLQLQAEAQHDSTENNNAHNVKAHIAKMETFKLGLDTFGREEIASLEKLKQEVADETGDKKDEIDLKFKQVTDKWDEVVAECERLTEALKSKESRLQEVDGLYLQFAKKASGFNSWFENIEEDLTDPIRCHSLLEIETLMNEYEEFCSTLSDNEKELDEILAIDRQLEALGCSGKEADNPHVSTNPYTWFTATTLQETWQAVDKLVGNRNYELKREHQRQLDNDTLRKEFAEHANLFHSWLNESRVQMMQESGKLESQLEAIKQLGSDIISKRTDLSKIEELGSSLEEGLILDNKYTEYSTLGLAQQWDQLEQLAMRMEHNLNQQIQARNMTGVSEEALKEFSLMFKHFDKDQTGRLEHDEFKSCLRSLGYDLPTPVDQHDHHFQQILDQVDPNRDGCVSLQEYMSFMISRETENVNSVEQVVAAFKALSQDGKPYVTKDELYQNLTAAQAEYCMREMPPYHDSHGIHILNAYDYTKFTKDLFIS